MGVCTQTYSLHRTNIILAARGRSVRNASLGQQSCACLLWTFERLGSNQVEFGGVV